MIKVVFYKKKDKYIGVYVSGHANYADYGKDIVCSAVSALVINTINSISTLTDDEITYVVSGGNAPETDDGIIYKIKNNIRSAVRPKKKTLESVHIEFKVPRDSSKETQLLIKSLRIGLFGIYEEYMTDNENRYLQLYFKEV